MGILDLLNDEPTDSVNTDELGSLLKSNDLGSLRESYSDLLLQSLKTPNRAEPDTGALAIQGALPMALAGLFAGRKGLAAAVDPVSEVYKTELARATTAADNERNQTIKAAALVENRIGDIEDRFDKRAALQQRKEDAEANRELRREGLEQSRLFHEDSVAMQRNNQAALEENRKALDEDRNESLRLRGEALDERRAKALDSAQKTVADAFVKEIKPQKEALEMLDKMQTALSDPSSFDAGTLRSMLNRGIDGEKGRIPFAQEVSNFPTGLRTKIQQEINYFTSGTTNVLTQDTMDALQQIIDKYKTLHEEVIVEKGTAFKTGRKYARPFDRNGAKEEYDDFLDGLIAPFAGGNIDTTSANSFVDADGNTVNGAGVVVDPVKIKSLANKLRASGITTLK